LDLHVFCKLTEFRPTLGEFGGFSLKLGTSA
jgi:hypothetical protein